MHILIHVSSSSKKVNGRRTMDNDDGRPTIEIGHPSDSGDQNIKNRHVHNIDHIKFSVFFITTLVG